MRQDEAGEIHEAAAIHRGFGVQSLRALPSLHFAASPSSCWRQSKSDEKIRKCCYKHHHRCLSVFFSHLKASNVGMCWYRGFTMLAIWFIQSRIVWQARKLKKDDEMEVNVVCSALVNISISTLMRWFPKAWKWCIKPFRLFFPRAGMTKLRNEASNIESFAVAGLLLWRPWECMRSRCDACFDRFHI